MYMHSRYDHDRMLITVNKTLRTVALGVTALGAAAALTGCDHGDRSATQPTRPPATSAAPSTPPATPTSAPESPEQRRAYVQPDEARTTVAPTTSAPASATPTPRTTTTAPPKSPTPRSTAPPPPAATPAPRASTTPSGTTLRIGAWTHTYVSAYGSQASLDACNAVEWEPHWIAGHNYCGYQFWAYLPVGQTITLTGKNAGTYVVTSRVYLPEQGGKKPALPAYDLALQTCKGAGTQIVLARKTA